MARKHKRNKQTPQALIMMGKGPVKKLASVSCSKWLGGQGPIFDPVQSKINKKLGYWA